ncbi:MAG: hypothetical protein IPJ88_09695 [Myxococcales bacterium]|nr:MAG: hypothetical protein IPJ88_09695 [Myxococcales bacterium]
MNEATLKHSPKDWAIFFVVPIGLGALMLILGLGHFGIWDPWELEIAESVRSAFEGQAQKSPWLLRELLLYWSYGFFGFHEWVGRLPLFVSGLLLLVTQWALLFYFVSMRAAFVSTLIALSTPLFLLNSRQMMGSSVAVLGQSLLFFALMLLGFTNWYANKKRALIVGLFLFFALGVAVSSQGVLLGVIPPALAVFVSQLVAPHRDKNRFVFLASFASVLALLVLKVGWSVLQDRSFFSWWLGGAAQGLQPPGFDKVAELIFHAFMPWSALLPASVLLFFSSKHSEQEGDAVAMGENALRLSLLLWFVFSCAANLLFSSRYGHTLQIPIVPLSSLTALFLLWSMDRRQTSLFVVVTTALLCLLLIRDIALYPESPLLALGLPNMHVPESYNPRKWWAALLLLFAMLSVFTWGTSFSIVRPAWGAPYRLMQKQWRASLGNKLWLGVFALAYLAVCALGLLSFLIPTRLPLAVLAIKALRAACLLPLVIALGVAGFQATAWFFSKLGRARFIAPLFAGLLLGVYLSQVYTPQVSAHFSPRQVYATFLSLSKAKEALAVYRVDATSGKYYAGREPETLSKEAELLNYLQSKSRVWVVLPSDEFAKIDRLFRKQQHKHLFLAHASSAKIYLASNKAISGVKNENPLLYSVRKTAPKVQFPVGKTFGDRIELVGYN